MRIVWLRSVVGERRRKAATLVAVLKMQAHDERAAWEAQRNNPRVGHGGQRFFHHLEILRKQRRKFGDRLADFCWIKRGQKSEWVEYELGNWSATMWTSCGRAANSSLPLEVRGQSEIAAYLRAWKVYDCGLAADNPRPTRVAWSWTIKFVASP